MPNQKSKRKQTKKQREACRYNKLINYVHKPDDIKKDDYDVTAEERTHIDDSERRTAAITYERVTGRIMRELMFPLDNFSKVISDKLVRHLSEELWVTEEGVKRVTHRGLVLPTGRRLSLLELHVRQIQFKIGIRLYEDLREYLTQYIRFDYMRGMIAVLPAKMHSVRDYPTYS